MSLDPRRNPTSCRLAAERNADPIPPEPVASCREHILPLLEEQRSQKTGAETEAGRMYPPRSKMSAGPSSNALAVAGRLEPLAPRRQLLGPMADNGSILDALEQEVHDRCPAKDMRLIHLSDRESPLAYKFATVNDRLKLELSHRSVALVIAMRKRLDRNDQPLPGLRGPTGPGSPHMLKSEISHRRGRLGSFEAVE